jgi:hypothetical protein
MVQAYARPGALSVVINQANGFMPANDILGRTRDATPDIGAFEVLPEDAVFLNGFETP